MLLAGTTLEGEDVERGVLLPLGEPAATASRRLAESGVSTVIGDAGFTVTQVDFGSQAAKLGIEAGFRIIAIEVAGEGVAPEWMFLPALMLIGWVAHRQRLRRARAAP